MWALLMVPELAMQQHSPVWHWGHCQLNPGMSQERGVGTVLGRAQGPGPTS